MFPDRDGNLGNNGLTPEETCKLLSSRFGESNVQAALDGGHPHAIVSADIWSDVALFLRDDPRTSLNLLRSISALDLLSDNRLACVYDLMSVSCESPKELIVETFEFAVRVEVDRDNPIVPSVARVWAAADWHEREAYDLMGIIFSGHDDLRRILCPDDWVGHPLRKDYEFPLEYHDIPATTEYELTNPRH